MAEKKLKIGIIGVGNIAQSHIEGYKRNENTELYAFCDIDREKLEENGKKHGVEKLFTDYNEMLALPELDAVSVCTWNSAHAPCVIAALNAGKHVLCEKPMSVSTEAAKEMKAAADKAGKVLMIGFVRRYGDDAQMINELRKNGELGDFYYGKATYLRRNGNPEGWFGDKSYSGGGPLIDLGVHVIDLTRWLMGNPKPVSVYGATFQKLLNRPNIKTPKDYVSTTKVDNIVCDVEDLATAMIRYDNGAVISIEASFSLDIPEGVGKYELFTDKGGVTVNPEVVLCKDRNGYMTDMKIATPTGFTSEHVTFDDVFAREITHFADCILGKEECMAPAEDGIEIMKILDAVYKSAETGHEVIIED